MGKKIVAVNASPRKGWNTDTLIDEAIRGAEAAGATVEKFDLFRMERFKYYQQTLSSFVGPTETLISGNTLQLTDYSKTDWPWTYFDIEDKKARHETVFPQECKMAFEKGEALVR